jgi:release factor glutamine methyltransferase
MSESELIERIVTQLRAASIADPEREAEQIIAAARRAGHGVGVERALSLSEMRAGGKPLAYVLGRTVFMGIELEVAEGALVPRDETQLLAQSSIEWLRASGPAAPRVIDMCCGAGNLACAVAYHIESAEVWASDLTDGCVAVARRNVSKLGLERRVHIAQGDLFAGLAEFSLGGTIDAIVCNPPYISAKRLTEDRMHLVEHEPREAFDGGPYGLSIHQRVIRECLPFLRPLGSLWFEIGLGQERQVKMLLERAKAYQPIQFFDNAQGETRVISACRKMD